jgi:deoxyribonuclease-4
VLNLAHIHARGHGRLRTSEDYGELFDQVRETIGTKEFYCHFSGVEHRMGNAMHYTQIKKSDLNFEPLAEFIIEEGSWLDMTLISDSPLLEHDAMYMLQNIEKARHKQLERKAREERRKALAAQTSMSTEEIQAREAQIAAARAKDALANIEAQTKKEEPKEVKEKPKKTKSEPAKQDDNDDLFEIEEDDDDLF